MKFVLASASPRRKELLEKIGLEFTIIPAEGEENMRFQDPAEAVKDLSRQKAEEVSGRLADGTDAVIIGADTAVSCGGQILGKPKDEADARRMLSMLQGQSHRVYTGVTLLIRQNGSVRVHGFFEETEVVMYPMEEEELDWYIKTREPFDKAGGYGIQGRCAVFIREIRGDYDNVVGLPVARLYQELKKLGIAVYSGS